MKKIKTLLPALVMLLVAPAWADDFSAAEKLELQRQEIFRTEFPLIVESLNDGSFKLFVAAIDQSDFLNRIYGLRLIDLNVKKSFNERAKFQFESLVKDAFRDSKGEIKAKILGIESRGDRGRAVVRFDLPNFQFSYHEYDLALDEDGRIVIIDWIDYLQGERYTDAVGTSLVMAAPSEAAVRKLIDYKNVKQNDLFQFTELLKAARDRRTEKYVEILSGLNPELQRQPLVVLLTVQLSKIANNRRFLRIGLMQMDEHAPEEPLFSLMLLDYYVPSQRYDKAIAALQRTYAKFGFDDAAMEARLSAITLAKGDAADANALAERAIRMQPELELAWWSALRARVAVTDFAGAVGALQRLEEDHGHKLGAEQLKGDKSFAALLASDEFKTWAAAR
jgi:tetratricopeptide (TPR) repeat protein